MNSTRPVGEGERTYFELYYDKLFWRISNLEDWMEQALKSMATKVMLLMTELEKLR